jgi:hypothetical protein
MEFLQGFKSYIAGFLIVLFAILYAIKIIDQQTFFTLVGIFSGLGIVAMRSAIAKIGKPQ